MFTILLFILYVIGFFINIHFNQNIFQKSDDLIEYIEQFNIKHQYYRKYNINSYNNYSIIINQNIPEAEIIFNLTSPQNWSKKSEIIEIGEINNIELDVNKEKTQNKEFLIEKINNIFVSGYQIIF